MTNIDVVIKIPEKYYDVIKEQVKNGNNYSPFVVIANGTPLPKGHGRLKDVDYGLKNCKDEHEIEYWDKEVLTIIAADKEREEPRQILKNCRNCGYPYKLAGKCYSCDDYSQWIPIEADKEIEE